jgi:hypothetical protein
MEFYFLKKINMLNKIINKYYKIRYKEYVGTSTDVRSDLQKQLDYRYEEIASGSVDTFRTVEDLNWKSYIVANQDGSGACVMFTLAKMAQVIYKLNTGLDMVFSKFPYKFRSNAPQPGMIGVEALSFAKKYLVPETSVPSENMNDKQMDALVTPPDLEDLNNYLVANGYYTANRDFNTVAEIVEKEGCAMIWINTDYKSWCKDIPSMGGFKEQVRHSVCVVDNITLNGIKYLVIEDSWGKFGGKYGHLGQRLITKEFFDESCYFVGALTNFEFQEKKVPKLKLKNTVSFGQKNSDVILLQNILKAKGYFPSNKASTGYYGTITANAVYKFQVDNKVDLSDVPIGEEGHYVGKKTLKTLAIN